MAEILYKLEQFEGPLDLCLSLIQKNKMKIEDIQISVLCDQYMEYINAAEAMDIELSSDFLLTASELMLIKSRMLLPRLDPEEEDPRAALAAAMAEYQRAKEAAVTLRELYAAYGLRMAKDTDEISVDKTYVADHDIDVLSGALMRILREVRVTDEEAKENFKPLIRTKAVSVSAVLDNLADRLRREKRVRIHGFFRSATSRTELVAMFLALLELLKSGMLQLMDESADSRDGVIDTSGQVYVALEPGADIEQLTEIVKDES